MKASLHNFKTFGIALAVLFFTTAFSTKGFAQGDIYPVSELSFTGNSSVCLNSIAPDLIFSFNTVECGTDPFNPIDITVTWYANTVNATTGGTQVFQEFSNTATTSFNYTVPTNIAGTLYYYVEVSWGTGTIICAVPGILVSSGTQQVDVNPIYPVSVSIVASSETICIGTSVIFTATPINGGSIPSYQWQINGVNTGTDSPVFTTSTLLNGDAVTVILTSDITPCATGNPATSNTVNMTVYPVLPVSVSILASATTICAGTTVTFTATPVNGGVSPSYQWQVNGVNTGTNSPVFTTSTLLNADAVTLILTSGIGACTTGNPATSNTVSMTVNAQQPVSVSIAASATTICAGTAVTFTATPSNGGTTPSYQWQVNGVNAGTNNPVFTTSTLANGDAVTVSLTSNITPCAAGNPATSNTVSMTVNALQPVSVSISASSTNICAGTSVTFTATPVNGGPSSSYQWKVNGVNTGTNSPTFTSTTLANGNSVTVLLTSNITPCATGNPATSNAIVMTVKPLPPVVTITPASATICQGNIQSLTASSGAASTFSTGSISVAIPDNNANGASNTLGVAGIPAGATITSINVTFNVSHNFVGDLVVNLRAPNTNVLNLVNRRGGNGDDFANTVVSSAGVTLFSAGAAPFTGTYAADAVNGVGSALYTSNVTAFNSLYSVPNGNWLLSIRDANAGTGGTLTSWTIQINWSYPITWSPVTDLYTDAGATIPYIAGQTFSTVYAQPLALGSTTYTATATHLNGCTRSNSAILTVNPSPTVNAAPASQTVCTGTAITSINITNPNSVPGTTFSWTRTTPGGLAGMPNSGTGSTIAGTLTNSTTAPITTTFTITATSGTCSNITTVTVTVNPIPTVSATNTSQTRCSGAAITNIVITNPNAVAGTTFSWTRTNTVNLTGIAASGAGSPIAGTFTNNTNVLQTTVFTITATAGGCSSSTTATIIVNPTPSLSVIPITQTLCTGVAITNIVITNPNAVAGTTYSWTRTNTVNLTGIAASGTSTTITGTLTNTTLVQQTTTFTITATSGSCSSTTTVNVIVNPIPTVNVIPNVAYCQNGNGAAVVFGSNIAGSTFTWTSTTNVGFGTSGSGNIPAFIAIGAPVTATVSVTATAAGCPGPVRTFTITVNPLPSVTIAVDYCIVPGKVRLTANPLPAGVYTYLWTTGATTSSIDVDIAGSYGVTVTNSNGCKATNSTSVATELAVNGNFEAGNTGFTTGYNYNAGFNGLQPEGNYAVNNNPNFNHTNFWGTDHTTGTGNMMIVNGLVGPTVWQETVPVVPNTTYYFSAWALSMNNIPPFAQLQFSVNGTTIGVSAVLVAGVNNNASNTNWQRFYGIWSSGPLTTATCSIVDLQGALGGNDFALDDISISTLSPAPFYVFPSVLGGGTAVCQGSTLNLSANQAGGSSAYTFSWTGPNGFTSNLQNPSIANASAVNTGNYTVTATDFYGCVVSGSRVITVTAPPVAPSPATATPSSICLGASSNLNGTTASGTQSDFTGFYTPSNWVTTNNPVLTGGSVNISGAPTQISITSGNNGTIGNTDYTITNGPVAGNFTFNWSYYSPLDIASRDIPQYSVNGGAGVNLPGYNTAGANTQSGTASIAVPANQTFTLRMRTTTGTLGEATTAFSIFSGPVTGRISWYNVPAAGASLGITNSTVNFPVTPGSAGFINYYAEAISGIGCTSSTRTPVSITVYAPPTTSNAGGAQTICVSGSATLAANTPAVGTGAWSVTSGPSLLLSQFSNTASTTSTFTPAGGAGSYVLRWTISNGSCTASFSSVTITVQTTPTASNAGTNQSICLPGSVTLAANNPVTGTGAWSVQSGPSLLLSQFSNPASRTSTFTPAGGAGSYVLRWTISNGVCSPSLSTVTISVSAAPTASNAGGPQTICSSASATLAANNPAIGTGAWSIVSGPSLLLTQFSSTTNPSAVFTPAGGGGAYVLRWTISNTPCTASFSNVTITVVTAAATANAGTDQFICGTNTTMAANSPAPGTGGWTIISGPSLSLAQLSSTTNPAAVFTAAGGSGNYTLRWTITNNPCPVIFDEVVISITAPITNNNIVLQTVCINSADSANVVITQGAGTVGGGNGVYTYVWEFSSPGAGGPWNVVGGNTATLTILQGGSAHNGFYRRKIISGNCTSTSSNVHVNTQNTVGANSFNVTGGGNYCSGTGGVPIGVSGSSDTVTGIYQTYQLFLDGLYTGISLAGNGGALNFGLQTAPGTYTVKVIISVINGTSCSPIAVNGNVTVTLNLPSAVSTGLAATPSTICVGSSTTLTQTGGSLGTGASWKWYSDNTYTTVVGTGTGPNASLTIVPAGTTTYYLRIEGTSSPCTADLAGPVAGVTVNVTETGTWLGFTNDWSDPANWCGGVPATSTIVSIPLVGSGIYPSTSAATAMAKDITIATGASVTVNGYVIQVAGTISNSGTFDIGNGTLELNGTTAAQDIAGSMFAGNTIKDLRISNTNGVNITGINDTLKLSGVLKFGTSNTILNTNGNLTLLSNASGTASIGDMTNNGADNGNDIIGDVTVERYIPSHFKAWQFLAVPTKGQTINAAWQEGNIPLSNSNHPGYGTLITSNIPGAVGLGFDVYTPSGPTMKSFDSTTHGWVGVSSPSAQIANRKGYMLFVRGDRSVTTAGQAATATILRTTGKLYTIGVEAPPVTNLDAGTFESIGNPYASAIDFGKLTKSGGVQDLFYVWDPKLTTSTYSAYGLGAYQTIIGPGPFYTVIPGGGSYAGNNTMIESGQAFLVHAPFNSGSISFTETAKVDGSNLVTRPSNSLVKQLRNNFYVFAGNSYVLLDGTLSQFDAAYSNAVDGMDAVKLRNTSENMAILRDDQKLVAERRAEIQRTDTIFYNLGQLRVQQYQFEFIAANLEQNGLAAFLEDKYLNTSTVINLHDTTRVMFSVINVPGSYAPDRFRVVFQKLAPTPVTITSIAASRNYDKSVSINWKVENETNLQLYTVERSEDGRDFSGIITADPLLNNGGNASYSRIDQSPLARENFYRIKALSNGGQVQYSAIVKLSPVKSATGLTVYPNPVTGKTIQLQFADQPTGNYQVTLVYSNGAEQQLSVVNVPAGQSTHSIPLPQLLASGIYRLKITGPAAENIIKTIHVSAEQ